MPASYTKLRGKDARGKQRYVVDPSHFLFNVDTLWYTLDAENYDTVMNDYFMSLLVEGRSYLDEHDQPLSFDIFLPGYLNPVSFEIHRGQRPVYAFSIRNEDFAIYFAKKRRADETFPMKVQINQFKLWQLGVVDAYVESLQIVACLGFIFSNAKPNRIDVCCHSDQFQWHCDDLVTFKWPRNVGETNDPDILRFNPVTREFGTVYFGSRSRLLLRIYNKSREAEEKNKGYFLDLYKKLGLNPDNVWNVEFEVHRDYLKDLTVDGKTGLFDDMETLLNGGGLSALWSHLVRDKFSHDSKFWEVLQKGDPDKFVLVQDRLIRSKDINTDKKREAAQIGGRLKKFVLDKDVPEGKEMEVALKEFIKIYFDYQREKGKDFRKEVQRQKRSFVDYMINSTVNASSEKVVTFGSQNKKPDQSGETDRAH